MELFERSEILRMLPGPSPVMSITFRTVIDRGASIFILSYLSFYRLQIGIILFYLEGRYIWRHGI